MKLLRITSVLVLMGLMLACKKDKDASGTTGNLLLLFNNTVNGQALQLNNGRYTNSHGDAYQVTKFKYYISHVTLRNTQNGQVFSEPDSYHLIAADQHTAVQSVAIMQVPIGEYNQLEFAVGVDSVKNASTDQVGDLDPSNEMAWDWNTGYKFLAMEGYFTKTDQSQGALVFHIGSNPNYRTLGYDLESLGKGMVTIQSAHTPQLTVIADVNGLFKLPNPVDFQQTNNVMGGPTAGKIADNYATGLFSIGTVQNQ